MKIALEMSHYSARELTCYITDHFGYYISESSIYRILRECDLLTVPTHFVFSASDYFKDKTSRPNQMWQTDFTYFKVIGWGWYYLYTVVDDYSPYIVAWELCQGMKSEDAQSTVKKAFANSGLIKENPPKLLCDNGSSYIAATFNDFLKDEKIQVIQCRPLHPQTQGKIERYN